MRAEVFILRSGGLPFARKEKFTTPGTLKASSYQNAEVQIALLDYRKLFADEDGIDNGRFEIYDYRKRWLPTDDASEALREHLSFYIDYFRSLSNNYAVFGVHHRLFKGIRKIRWISDSAVIEDTIKGTSGRALISEGRFELFTKPKTMRNKRHFYIRKTIK